MTSMGQLGREAEARDLDLARVLLVHGELAPRLTLQTVLRAGGYSVDVAASAAEALAKLDDGEYELVLSGEAGDSGDSGRRLLAYARVKDYRPATAVVTAYPEYESGGPGPGESQQQVSIDTEDVSRLLSKVAELIGARATRRAVRGTRRALRTTAAVSEI